MLRNIAVMIVESPYIFINLRLFSDLRLLTGVILDTGAGRCCDDIFGLLETYIRVGYRKECRKRHHSLGIIDGIFIFHVKGIWRRL